MNNNYLTDLGEFCLSLEKSYSDYDIIQDYIEKDNKFTNESLNKMTELLNVYISFINDKTQEGIFANNPNIEKIWSTIRRIIEICLNLIYKGLKFLSDFIFFIMKKIDKILLTVDFDALNVGLNKHKIFKNDYVSIKKYKPNFVTEFDKFIKKLKSFDIENMIGILIRFGVDIGELMVFDDLNKDNIKQNIKDFAKDFFKEINLGTFKNVFDFLNFSNNDKNQKNLSVRININKHFFDTNDKKYLQKPSNVETDLQYIIYKTEMLDIIKNHNNFMNNVYYIKEFYFRVYPKMNVLKNTIKIIQKSYDKIFIQRLNKSLKDKQIMFSDSIVKIISNLISVFCNTSSRFFDNVRTSITVLSEVAFSYKLDTRKVISKINKIIYNIK